MRHLDDSCIGSPGRNDVRCRRAIIPSTVNRYGGMHVSQLSPTPGRAGANANDFSDSHADERQDLPPLCAVHDSVHLYFYLSTLGGSSNGSSIDIAALFFATPF